MGRFTVSSMTEEVEVEADRFEVDESGTLRLLKGEVSVAVYAKGSWHSALLVAENEQGK